MNFVTNRNFRDNSSNNSQSILLGYISYYDHCYLVSNLLFMVATNRHKNKSAIKLIILLNKTNTKSK
jgi:hypothetical protein